MYEERVDALSAKDQKANVVCLLGKKHGNESKKRAAARRDKTPVTAGKRRWLPNSSIDNLNLD